MIFLRIHLGSSSLALEAACPGHQQYSTRQNERGTSLPPTQPSSEARDGSRRAFPPAELNFHGGRWRQCGDPALMPITQITSHCKISVIFSRVVPDSAIGIGRLLPQATSILSPAKQVMQFLLDPSPLPANPP